MLATGNASSQMREWLDRLAPLADRARAELAAVAPGKLVMRTGCVLDHAGNFCLTFMGRSYEVAATDFGVRQRDTGEAPSPFTESLIRTYLATADGTTPSGRWVGFRELPDGLFYVQAFQGYSGSRMVRELADSGIELLGAVRHAGAALGGSPVGIGDVGYAFAVLPRVQIALTCWAGDEELPSQATVLFEDTAAHYMPTDGLAILGSQLVDRVLAVARRL